MKRRITLSIALVLSIVLVSLMSSDSRVKAQPQRFVFDTGIIDLDLEGEREVTLTVATGAGDDAVVQFRQMNYIKSGCTNGICKLAASPQSQSAPISLAAGEGVSLSVPGNQMGADGTRLLVLSNSRNVRVNAMIVDATTGEVQSLLALLLP